MTVGELRKILDGADPNANVVLARSADPGDFSPAHNADTDAVYDADRGHIYSASWSAREALMTDERWKALKSRSRCVVLYPVT